MLRVEAFVNCQYFYHFPSLPRDKDTPVLIEDTLASLASPGFTS